MPPKKGRPANKKKRATASRYEETDWRGETGRSSCKKSPKGREAQDCPKTADGRTQQKGKRRSVRESSPTSERSASPAESYQSSGHASDNKHSTPKSFQRKKSRARSESPLSVVSHTRALPDLEDVETLDKYDNIEIKDPEPTKKWTPRKESLLATLWEDEPHLYDATDHTYRDSIKRRETLQRFSAALNMSVHDVDTHMTSVRMMYTKAVQVPSGSAADKMTFRQRELKHMLSFLKKHVKPLKGLSNLPRTEGKVGKPTATARQHDDDFLDLTDNSPSHDARSSTYKRKLKMEDDDNNSTYSSGQNMKYGKKDNANVNVMGKISSSMSTMAQVFASRNSAPKNPDQEDSHGIWAKLFAMKLRQIPYHKAERVKVKMDAMVLDIMEED